MKTKLGVGLNILAFVLPLLGAGSTQAAKTEGAAIEITKFEARLQKIEQKLEQIDSPFQQMGPEAVDEFESGISSVQMSFDEVSERLAMIRFVINREGSAPDDKRELAQAELGFMEADIADLESESSSLANDVDAVVWY